ncbi:hypothetical protein O9929_27605 [Vibrio lentus]|nr:hypothetical protein [Vibrio lentus]
MSTGSICDGIDIDIGGIYNYATGAEFEDIQFILEKARTQQ